MYIKRITHSFAISALISPKDIRAIHTAGFKSLMCNLPLDDADAPDNTQEIEEIAGHHGITFYMLPLESADFSPTKLKTFGEFVQNTTGPLLAYCRSGERCADLLKAYIN